jgi:hypothetical protein
MANMSFANWTLVEISEERCGVCKMRVHVERVWKGEEVVVAVYMLVVGVQKLEGEVQICETIGGGGRGLVCEMVEMVEEFECTCLVQVGKEEGGVAVCEMAVEVVGLFVCGCL